jgi:hypothetical protein
MILFSVGAGGLSDGGELSQMTDQVDPLNGLQGRVKPACESSENRIMGGQNHRRNPLPA